MSGNTFGKLFTLTTFGESHGPAIGGIVDGCPPNLSLDETDLQKDLDRRRPGSSHYTTQRQEPDQVKILSGVFEGKTTGTPIGLLIENVDQKSKDYNEIKDLFRPGHADYTYYKKYGIRDYRGGGRASARETAIRVAAGAIAKKYLREKFQMEIRGYIAQIGSIHYEQFDWDQVDKNPFSFPDVNKIEQLEDLDIRNYAAQDPRGFLSQYSHNVIFDEIQKVPSLFSYLQSAIDANKRAGQFILTGSQNFLLMENISQSLAGRIALLQLLPLTISELERSHQNVKEWENLVLKGFYPRIYESKLDPRDWYPNYIQTYIERDVRQIKNVYDLGVFQKFIKMCASRTGQLLNLSSLAVDCGITHNTAKSWISLLEASYIIFLLQPYHNNLGKRLVKMPKLYFYDTGLLCALLGIADVKQLSTHYLRGGIFETLIISELLKKRYNQGKPNNLYFWRDKVGHEIDCLIEEADKFIPIEIKSGKTINADFFTGLNYWCSLKHYKIKQAYIVYSGDKKQQRQNVNALSWRDLDEIEF